jgi:hypothetical protein
MSDDNRDVRIMVGSVVQIDPAHDDVFGGSFLVVTEMKTWGVMGYVTIPGKDGGAAYRRVAFDKVIYIGQAEWVVGREEAGER